jgi:hypothetical protein
MLVRLFRSLDALVGGDDRQARAWLHAMADQVGGVPAERIRTVKGVSGIWYGSLQQRSDTSANGGTAPPRDRPWISHTVTIRGHARWRQWVQSQHVRVTLPAARALHAVVQTFRGSASPGADIHHHTGAYSCFTQPDAQ